MGIARLLVSLLGVAFLVGALWIFLTRTELGGAVPQSWALVAVLALIGFGLMVSAKAIGSRFESRTIVREGATTRPAYVDHEDRGDTVVEERRRTL